MKTDIKPIEYRTTKESCQAAIDLNGFVCSRCGGDRSPIETVDNSGHPTFWAGCEHCQVFDYGVPLLIFKIAEDMVVNQHYIHYGHDVLESPIDKDEMYQQYWKESQIGGTTMLVSQVLRTHRQFTNGNEYHKTIQP